MQEFKPKVDAKKNLPSFPGRKLFSEQDAEKLAGAIRDFTALQPQAVVAICEREGGRPTDQQISRVERTVSTRGCAALAIETTHLLGGDLSSEKILDLVEESGLDYRKIPQAVHSALSSKS